MFSLQVLFFVSGKKYQIIIPILECQHFGLKIFFSSAVAQVDGGTDKQTMANQAAKKRLQANAREMLKVRILFGVAIVNSFSNLVFLCFNEMFLFFQSSLLLDFVCTSGPHFLGHSSLGLLLHCALDS